MIHQSWRRGQRSRGTAVWRLDPSGARLRISESVRDSHFEDAIEFAATYERP